jgi:hypothetical protein
MEEFKTGNKGTEAAIATLTFIRQQASLTHQKKSNFIAHWSFADEQGLQLKNRTINYYY